MTTLIKNATIIASILVFAAYAIFRYAKQKKTDLGNNPIPYNNPISYEEILSKAISKIKKAGKPNKEYKLSIIPPSKSKDFLKSSPDYFKNLSVKDLETKLLVIWFVQFDDNVIYEEAVLSNSLANDFTDIIPSDKIYVKTIKIND